MGALDGRKAVIVLTICTLDRCSGVVLDRDQELCSFWPRSMDVLTSVLWGLRKRWQNWPNQSNKSDLQSDTFRGGKKTKCEGNFQSLQFAKELQEFDGIGFVNRDGKAVEHVRSDVELPRTSHHYIM